MRKAGISRSARPDDMSHERDLLDGEWSSWEEVHRFATSFRSSAPPTATTQNDDTKDDMRVDDVDVFINNHRTEPYRGRGHLMQEMAFKDVQFMDYRTSQELRSTNINMRDPDISAIKAAAVSKDSAISLDVEEPRFVRAQTTRMPESPEQYEDAELPMSPGSSPTGSQGCHSYPQTDTYLHSGAGSYYHGVSGRRTVHPSAIDAFNFKIDESNYAKVDPASLHIDAPTPSPCSSPLPDDLYLLEEADTFKTDTKVENAHLLNGNTSTPVEPQHAPDPPSKDCIRDFILSFRNTLSEHPEVLTCFLDVVSAWTSEEITFMEMEETLTQILSESFPDLLRGFIKFTKDIDFPQISVNASVKPRRNHRNLVVMNFWKKEEERRKAEENKGDGKAHPYDLYVSIIKECVNELRKTEVLNERAQTADRDGGGVAVKSGAVRGVPEDFPELFHLLAVGRGRAFAVADLD